MFSTYFLFADTEKVVSNSESDEEFCDTSEINPAQVLYHFNSLLYLWTLKPK